MITKFESPRLFRSLLFASFTNPNPLRLCARLHRYAKRHGLATRTGLREALRAGLGVRFYPLLQAFGARRHSYAKRLGLPTRPGLREALQAATCRRLFRPLRGAVALR